MTSIDKAAIFWSIAIVAIGVSIASYGLYSPTQSISPGHQTISPKISQGDVFFTLQGQDSVGNIDGDVFDAGPKMTYVSISKDGKLILATSSASDTIFAFDKQGNKLSEISVGKTPKGVKIHPTENIAFVANENSGTISVINFSDWKTIDEISVGKIPHNIVFHPNGLIAYVTIQGGDEIAIIDVATKS